MYIYLRLSDQLTGQVAHARMSQFTRQAGAILPLLTNTHKKANAPKGDDAKLWVYSLRAMIATYQLRFAA